MGLFRAKTEMVEPAKALPGRDATMPVPERHLVLGSPLVPPFPEGFEMITVGMGCFWGAERKFWQAEGVFTTAVGYAQGYTRNPSYEEVCSGRTGHAEVVLAVFDPSVEAAPFYYAEPYHQQYLAANPNGYCGLGGTGLSCPVGVASAE